MRIGIIGAGRIGGNAARLLANAGHQVRLSFSRDPANLQQLAREIGANATTGTAADAVAFAEVVVFSVPWGVIPDALEEAGSLQGKIVIDTTNQFSGGPVSLDGRTAAQFNTLTAAFQAEAAGRTGPQRVVQWICGDDEEAKQVVARLVDDAGFQPVDLGGTAECEVMEAPRRAGAVYGEEYRLADAVAVVEAVRAGRPIPPTPGYGN